MVARRSLLALCCCSLLVACGGDDPSSSDAGSSGDDAGTADESGSAAMVRYHEEVRPILAQHCGSCHTAGAIAPFALDTYDEAREWGPAVAAAVAARTMPPFGVNNDGSCNTYADARWLSEEEIDTVAAWVEGGYEVGDDSIPAPHLPAPKQLTGAITELTLPQYTPSVADDYGGFEDYHCFPIDLELSEPRYITGFDVLPGDPKLVHHVLGFRVIPGFLGNDETMAELDAATPDLPGWKCYGAAGDGVLPSGVPVTWAPGTGATQFPDGVGIRVDPGDLLVVQVHYDLSEGTGADQTRLQLEMADAVDRTAFQTLWDPFLFSEQFGNPQQLPPGLDPARFEWDDTIEQMLALDSTTQVPEDEFDVLAIIPHMHERGLRMSIEIETGEQMQCAADVDRWDFGWQQAYFLEEPISVTADDRFHVACEWDTTGDSEPILPGFGTDDEMCLIGVLFAPK